MVSADLQDELDAIEAIYPECLTRINEGLVDLKIPGNEQYKLRVSFPAEYPETEPPHILQVQAPRGYDDQYLLMLFDEVLASVFTPGAVCIFDFLTEMEGVLYVEEDTEEAPVVEVVHAQVDPLDGWTMSEPVTDRGSTFIAFSKEVHSEDDVYEALSALKTDKKVGRANHNMVAYRIQNADGTRLSDCDDDGESAAGGRMLHLLTIMDVWNCIVVVSRWFGGTHIGPDRFKHINSTARDAVIKGGFYSEDKKKKSKR